MTKILSSGIEVDAEGFYKLLEWKDGNMKKFIFFCREYRIEPCINLMNMETYKALLQFSNLD